jgi:hypothetical protein
MTLCVACACIQYIRINTAQGPGRSQAIYTYEFVRMCVQYMRMNLRVSVCVCVCLCINFIGLSVYFSVYLAIHTYVLIRIFYVFKKNKNV